MKRMLSLNGVMLVLLLLCTNRLLAQTTPTIPLDKVHMHVVSDDETEYSVCLSHPAHDDRPNEYFEDYVKEKLETALEGFLEVNFDMTNRVATCRLSNELSDEQLVRYLKMMNMNINNKDQFICSE